MENEPQQSVPEGDEPDRQREARVSSSTSIDQPGDEGLPPELTERGFHEAYQVISAEIARAERSHDDIDSDAVRAISMIVTDILGNDGQSMAELPTGEYTRLRSAVAEASTLFSDPELPAELAGWVGWLAVWAVGQLPARPWRGVTPIHGDAFRAFMQLPDVEPGSLSVLNHFDAAYVGVFDDFDSIVDSLTDAERWQEDLDEFAQERGVERMVWLDRAALQRIVLATWDISVVNEKFYLFGK